MPLNAKDPRFQKLLLGLLGLAGLLYCFFFTTWVPFTYKANASQLSALSAQYMSMTKDLNKARQSAHQLSYLEREYELLHRKWEQGQALLPQMVDMAWVLRTLTLMGNQSGVEFTLFRPLPPKPAQYHTENPIEIKAVGGYHQIGAFLAEVANLSRIVNVTNLEITTNKDRIEDQPAAVSFVAVTYTLGGTGVPPGQTGAAGKDKSARAQAAGGSAAAAAGGTAGGSEGATTGGTAGTTTGGTAGATTGDHGAAAESTPRPAPLRSDGGSGE